MKKEEIATERVGGILMYKTVGDHSEFIDWLSIWLINCYLRMPNSSLRLDNSA